ncbi:MAG: WD40 repeat domain-containing protein [Candidatus Lokiarchaeota archaeon]|nr:WD40 repeat domain-containing protein [Candidatus Lokiarchaeota archaeon]
MNDRRLGDGKDTGSIHYTALYQAAEFNKDRYSLRRLNGLYRRTSALCFSWDNRFIANGGDGRVELYNVQTGEWIREYRWDGGIFRQAEYDVVPKSEKEENLKHVMESVAFSPDGGIIFGGDKTGSVYAWDMVTGALRWCKKGITDGAMGEGHCSGAVVAASPIGNIVASGGGGYVRAWNADSGTLIAEIEMATAGRPHEYDRDDETIALLKYYNEDATRHVVDYHPYNKSDQKFLKWFYVTSLAFSPDGSWIACGMAAQREVVDPILAIDTRTWQARQVMGPNRLVPGWWVGPGYVDFEYNDVNAIGFSTDGRVLVAVGEEGARLYDVVDRRKEGGLTLRGGTVIGYDWRKDPDCDWSPCTTGASFLGNSNIVLIAHEGSIIEGIDAQDVRTVRGSLENQGEPGDVKSKFIMPGDGGYKGILAVSPDGRWLALGGNTGFVVVDIGDLKS